MFDMFHFSLSNPLMFGFWDAMLKALHPKTCEDGWDAMLKAFRQFYNHPHFRHWLDWKSLQLQFNMEWWAEAVKMAVQDLPDAKTAEFFVVPDGIAIPLAEEFDLGLFGVLLAIAHDRSAYESDTTANK